MLERIPSDEELILLVGKRKFAAFKKFCNEVDLLYEAERTWNNGGRNWNYEYKYRRGGKTLCAMYAKEKQIGLMIIFGGGERAKFDEIRKTLSQKTQEIYDAATTYHDGKWVMFDENLPLSDLRAMLAVKRKPNRQ